MNHPHFFINTNSRAATIGILTSVPLPISDSEYRYRPARSYSSSPVNMRCLVYVAATIVSAAVTSADPCPRKPTCDRVDCYNDWVDCRGTTKNLSVPMVSLWPHDALTASTTVLILLQGIADYLKGNHEYAARGAHLLHAAVNYPERVAQRTTVMDITKTLDPWNI